jgi:hypothetical protein
MPLPSSNLSTNSFPPAHQDITTILTSTLTRHLMPTFSFRRAFNPRRPAANSSRGYIRIGAHDGGAGTTTTTTAAATPPSSSPPPPLRPGDRRRGGGGGGGGDAESAQVEENRLIDQLDEEWDD